MIACDKSGTHFPSFPMRREFSQRGKIKAMKTLQKILFTFAMVVGLTLAISAQKDDKKPPKKETPPVVVPQPKPPQNPPPKKPNYAIYVSVNLNENELY